MLILPRASRALNLFVRYLGPVVSLLTLAEAAQANPFNVNSTADIVNPPTGVLSLRSVIQSANSISLTPPLRWRPGAARPRARSH